MKNFPIVILLFLSMASCKKDTPNTTKPTDNILYNDIIPDTNLISIDSILVISNGPYCIDSKTPYPSEGKTVYKIDVNADNVIDFHISVSHSSITCSYPKCGNYKNYSCALNIAGQNNGDSVIIIKENSGYQHIFFKENETITSKHDNETSEWSSLFSGNCPPTPTDDIRDCYIGIKMNGCIGWIHIDRVGYGITVLDYAINLTKGNSIIAGKID